MSEPRERLDALRAAVEQLLATANGSSAATNARGRLRYLLQEFDAEAGEPSPESQGGLSGTHYDTPSDTRERLTRACYRGNAEDMADAFLAAMDERMENQTVALLDRRGRDLGDLVAALTERVAQQNHELSAYRRHHSEEMHQVKERVAQVEQELASLYNSPLLGEHVATRMSAPTGDAAHGRDDERIGAMSTRTPDDIPETGGSGNASPVQPAPAPAAIDPNCPTCAPVPAAEWPSPTRPSDAAYAMNRAGLKAGTGPDSAFWAGWSHDIQRVERAAFERGVRELARHFDDHWHGGTHGAAAERFLKERRQP